MNNLLHTDAMDKVNMTENFASIGNGTWNTYTREFNPLFKQKWHDEPSAKRVGSPATFLSFAISLAEFELQFGSPWLECGLNVLPSS